MAQATPVVAAATAAPAASEPKKLWGGRFTGKTDPLMEKFNESLPFDKRMWAEDIQGSQAYAKALAKCGILTAEESATIVEGLSKVHSEWAAGAFVIKQGDEDIHTANERRLTELVGSVGGKLHTGRSRNDQTPSRTHQMETSPEQTGHQEPRHHRFTHLQPAMTVRWSHWVMCHASSWQRDDMRLDDLLPRVATLPLGSGALAGNPFGVDRQFIARELGFIGGVCPNSMDAVSDRDYVIETTFMFTLLLTHLSRWAEDLIIYSTLQFGFVQCSDAYATGSSLMPQKKNPDALELVRGKAARMQGNLAGLMAVLKGTPTTYNKDFQECWEMLFDTVDTAHDVIRIATGVMSTLKLRPEKMLASLSPDMLATDLAEYLMAEDRAVPLSSLSLEDLQSIHPLFSEDVALVWDFDRSAEMRDTEGGASKRSVKEQVAKMRKYLAENRAPKPTSA
ncbi:MAG: hypothetical protein WDW38_006016 [Sanguina aurantia]